MREIGRAARSFQQKMREDACLGEVEYVTTTMPTGEVEILGPGKVLIEDKQKVEIVTAEKLIKEAKEKKI